MNRYRCFLSCVCIVFLLVVLFTACGAADSTASVASESLQTSSIQTQPTGFENSNTAKLIIQDESNKALCIDADCIADFSAWNAQGINVSRMNMIVTAKDYPDNLQLYMKIQLITDSGNIVMYTDNQYLYIVNDYEKVNYRYNLGFNMDFIKSMGEDYEKFAKEVSSYEFHDITLYGKVYRGEKFVKAGESQTWCYDENGNLKYIIYHDAGNILKINTYKFEFNENVFTVPVYHTVDTGESIIFLEIQSQKSEPALSLAFASKVKPALCSELEFTCFSVDAR